MRTRRAVRLLFHAWRLVCFVVISGFVRVVSATAGEFDDYQQTEATISVAPDAQRWELEGQAKPIEYQGRKCLFLDGGVAVIKDLEMRDGVVDVDVSTPASRGFFGIQFRIAKDGANSEWVYLRQHKSGQSDACNTLLCSTLDSIGNSTTAGFHWRG
jgi:hypothetical protein